MKQKPGKQESDLPKISAPARRALTAAGVKSLEDLTIFTEKEILQLHGMGPNAMGKLKIAMKEKKLLFK